LRDRVLTGVFASLHAVMATNALLHVVPCRSCVRRQEAIFPTAERISQPYCLRNSCRPIVPNWGNLQPNATDS